MTTNVILREGVDLTPDNIGNPFMKNLIIGIETQTKRNDNTFIDFPKGFSLISYEERGTSIDKNPISIKLLCLI